MQTEQQLQEKKEKEQDLLNSYMYIMMLVVKLYFVKSVQGLEKVATQLCYNYLGTLQVAHK